MRVYTWEIPRSELLKINSLIFGPSANLNGTWFEVSTERCVNVRVGSVIKPYNSTTLDVGRVKKIIKGLQRSGVRFTVICDTKIHSVSLKDVSDRMRISVRNVKTKELLTYTELPKRDFRIGFEICKSHIRVYLTLLHVDNAKLYEIVFKSENDIPKFVETVKDLLCEERV